MTIMTHARRRLAGATRLAWGGWYPIICTYNGLLTVSVDGDRIDVAPDLVDQSARGLTDYAVTATADDGRMVAVCPEGHHAVPELGLAGVFCENCGATYGLRDESAVERRTAAD